jgi:hypothetical protein
VPLYQGGLVKAASRQAASNREQANTDLQVETDKQLLELRKDFDALSSAARIGRLTKAVETVRLLGRPTCRSSGLFNVRANGVGQFGAQTKKSQVAPCCTGAMPAATASVTNIEINIQLRRHSRDIIN